MIIIALLQILGYGLSFDAVDELCGLSKSSGSESFYALVDEILEIFGNAYLCNRNEMDPRNILSIGIAMASPSVSGRETVNTGNGRTVL